MKPGDNVVNVSQLVDDTRFTRRQFLVVALCVLVGLLDDADTQSIGVAAPFIAGSLALKISSFGPVFAAFTLATISVSSLPALIVPCAFSRALDWAEPRPVP